MTRIKRSFVLLLVTMTLGATYGHGCSLLGQRFGASHDVAVLQVVE